MVTIMETINIREYPKIKDLLKKALPNYRKRGAFLSVCESVAISGTYWSGGSRDSYIKADLSGRVLESLPQYNPPQFGGPKEDPRVYLDDFHVVISCGIFCGKTATVHIYGTEYVINNLKGIAS
jgi:hypothetical protein